MDAAALLERRRSNFRHQPARRVTSPRAARAFVDAVAAASGVPVRLVSVGADRAQYLTR